MADTRSDWRAGLGRRWPYYALAAVFVALAAAWFDGGEEALHPIEQSVTLTGTGTGTGTGAGEQGR